MSELHLQLEARFNEPDTCSRIFRGLYSHKTDRQNHSSGLAEFQGLGLDASSILNESESWILEDCGVDEKGMLYLKAAAASSKGYDVFRDILHLIDKGGATALLAVEYDDGTGDYYALTVRQGEIFELYHTYDYESVGDDFYVGVKNRLAEIHGELARLRRESIL